MLAEAVYTLKQDLFKRWIICHPRDLNYAWSGSRWVRIGGPVQVCNFTDEAEARSYAEGRLAFLGLTPLPFPLLPESVPEFLPGDMRRDEMPQELRDVLSLMNWDHNHYILSDDGRTPLPCDLMTWAIWLESDLRKRVLRQIYIKHRGCWYFVSTVFLGLNHRFGPGAPILWETMIFREKYPPHRRPHYARAKERVEDNPSTDIWCERYSSYEEALAGHTRAVNFVWSDCREEEWDS